MCPHTQREQLMRQQQEEERRKQVSSKASTKEVTLGVCGLCVCVSHSLSLILLAVSKIERELYFFPTSFTADTVSSSSLCVSVCLSVCYCCSAVSERERERETHVCRRPTNRQRRSASKACSKQVTNRF
jgi:hypothetical protein